MSWDRVGDLRWNAPASVVNDFLHNTANVTITFGVIEWTELCRRFVVVGVRFELVIKKTSCKRCVVNNAA